MFKAVRPQNKTDGQRHPALAVGTFFPHGPCAGGSHKHGGAIRSSTKVADCRSFQSSPPMMPYVLNASKQTAEHYVSTHADPTAIMRGILVQLQSPNRTRRSDKVLCSQTVTLGSIRREWQ